MQDWRSTDEQEIARRQLRALEQPPAIRNLTPKHRIFSTFEVTSPESELTYYVEIRELAGRDFHSTSPDFSHNGLGTCKHTEAVLFHLQKRFPGLYKKALKGGSGRCDLVEDTATKTLRLVIPANADLPRGFCLNFDKKGLLKPAKDSLKVLAKAGEIEDANFRVCQSVVPFLESRARERPPAPARLRAARAVWRVSSVRNQASTLSPPAGRHAPPRLR